MKRVTDSVVEAVRNGITNQQMERLLTTLDRLCRAVEALSPPTPDSWMDPESVEVTEIPDYEPDETDESAGLESLDPDSVDTLTEAEYERQIMEMSDAEYKQFVIRSGSDPRPKIRNKIRLQSRRSSSRT